LFRVTGGLEAEIRLRRIKRPKQKRQRISADMTMVTLADFIAVAHNVNALNNIGKPVLQVVVAPFDCRG
jgi:hypothetical protein